MYLSKDAILKSDDLKRADVDCPEWGGTVLVRELTARERDKHEATLLGAASLSPEERTVALENLNARIAAAGIIGEDGQKLFPDVTDVLALGEKASSAVTRVAEKIAEMSGMTPSAVEDAEGNSDAAPSGDSTSE